MQTLTRRTASVTGIAYCTQRLDFTAYDSRIGNAKFCYSKCNAHKEKNHLNKTLPVGVERFGELRRGWWGPAAASPHSGKAPCCRVGRQSLPGRHCVQCSALRLHNDGNPGGAKYYALSIYRESTIHNSLPHLTGHLEGRSTRQLAIAIFGFNVRRAIRGDSLPFITPANHARTKLRRKMAEHQTNHQTLPMHRRPRQPGRRPLASVLFC